MRSMRILSAFSLPALLLALAADAVAAPSARPLPKEAQAVLSDMRQACTKAGGAGLRLQKQAIRTLDLNGDGRHDFILDFHHVECRRLASAFCGTGGCPLAIVVSQPHSRHATVFRGQVIRHDVLTDTRPARIRFHLHGTYCGGAGADPCVKIQAIDGGSFAFRDPSAS